MTDLNEWLGERRRVHSEATEGQWEASGATAATAWSGGWNDDGPIDDREQVASAAPEDVESIVDAHNSLPALLTAVENVLELHTKSPGVRRYGIPRADKSEHYCTADREAWPCSTVRSIEGAIK